MAGLKGKQVALVVGSTSPFELSTALRRQHISPSTVRFINTEPAAMVSDWEWGSIHAAYVWDPVFDTLLHDGSRALAYDQMVAAVALIFNLTRVNGLWGRAPALLVREFLQAKQKAVAFYAKHPSLAMGEMAKESGISPALARTELTGYHFYNAQAELTLNGLGQGVAIKHALVTKSLVSEAAYLKRIGSIRRVPRNLFRHVNPRYDAYVVHHGG